MPERASVFGFGPFRLDILRRSFERDGQSIALSGKAMEILAVLLERRGEVVDKDVLMRRVWPDTAVEENNITVAISALRKALGETAPTAKWIVTIPGRGYRFVGPDAAERLTGEHLPALNRSGTENPSAHTNYLRGRYYAKKYSEDGFRRALDYLQAAIDCDPGYALAHCGLADLFYDASNLVFPPRDVMPRAKAAARRAVELDPSLAAAHVSLGLIASKYEWDWEVAEREFQAALGIDPNLATAHLWFGTYRAQIGDFHSAFAALRRAQELDPLSGEINAYLGLVLYWARQYDESIHQFRQAITFDPAFVPSYVCFGWVLAANGDAEAALEACGQAVERQPNAWTTLALARAQALAGDQATAASTMARIGREAPRFVSGYDRAAVHAALGEPDEAFAALEEAYQARAEWMGYLKVDPQMDTLRNDPRFATFLRRLHF